MDDNLSNKRSDFATLNGPLAQIPHRNQYLNDSDDDTSVHSSLVSMPKIMMETSGAGASSSSTCKSIARVPRFAQTGTDYTLYIKAEKVSDDEFILKHVSDEGLDITVTRDVDEDCESIDWEGLSHAAINFVSTMDFQVQLQYPIMCLTILLSQMR